MSYIRVRLNGRIGTQEVWSVNPAYNESTDQTGWSQTAAQETVDAIAALNPPNALRNLASRAGSGTLVRIERRTDTHALVGAAEAGWTGWQADTFAPTKTPQTALVLSLRSNVPGSRGRGRLYWPALNGPLDGDTFRISETNRNAIALAAATYLKDIQDILTGNLFPPGSLSFHRLCIVSPTTGTRTDVSRIEVGDVLDTQRRRRDKLVETFSTEAYPPEGA